MRKSKALHKLRRLFQRLGIRMTRAMNPIDTTQYSESEREAILIFRRLLKVPESDILTSPLTGKYYIRTEDLLVVLGNGRVSIVNHVYGYDIPLSQRAERKLIDMFLEETEKRRSAMEQEYRGNVQHSLKTIISRLDEKLN
jgi:hypothetical protein